jgi:CubicO group peptidase (beta-lactamase class C family)
MRTDAAETRYERTDETMTTTSVQASVQTLLDDIVRSGTERGLQVAAYQDGELVVDAWAGDTDATSGQPVDGDSLFTVFSCSKGITATVIHLLAERGQLDYDDPIATYWPEFAANGKEGVTVRHALTHTAGIPETPRGVGIANWDAMCRAIAEMTPQWEPGTQSGYHSLTFGWILGELARRVAGRPIERIVAEDIAQPLGTTSLYFGIPDDVESRVAALENDPDTVSEAAASTPALFNRSETRRAVIPAGGGIMNARSLAQHYAALVGDGIGGVRLLPPERVRAATALQFEGRDIILDVPSRKGLGYFLGRHTSPMGERVAAFGHPGHGGSIGFADPEYRFAFALTKNRLVFPAPGESTANRVANAVRDALGIPTDA